MSEYPQQLNPVYHYAIIPTPPDRVRPTEARPTAQDYEAAAARRALAEELPESGGVRPGAGEASTGQLECGALGTAVCQRVVDQNAARYNDGLAPEV